MKKLLILILIALVLALTIFTIVSGIELGNFEILGIKGIQSKNEELDKQIEEATKLVTVAYPRKISEMNNNIKVLEENKQKYEDMVSVSTSDEVLAATQISNYQVETLWTTIGIHAKKNGVVINMSITKGTGEENNYNLNFTVNGSYINISEFVRSLEDDSTLGFKIDEFSLKPGTSDNDLQATFVCKNIIILGVTQSTITKPNENDKDNANTTNTNNTTNNTTNTSNTTNNTANTTNNTANTTDTTNNTTNTTDNTNETISNMTLQ